MGFNSAFKGLRIFRLYREEALLRSWWSLSLWTSPPPSPRMYITVLRGTYRMDTNTNKIDTARVTSHCNTCAVSYLLRYCKRVKPFLSKGALLWRFNVADSKTTYLGLRLKCPIFLPSYKKSLDSSDAFFIKIPNIKFNRNPSSGSRTDTQNIRMGERANNLIMSHWKGASFM